jgi:hypothetical protein
VIEQREMRRLSNVEAVLGLEGMRRVRLRPDAEGASTRESPEQRPSGWPALRVIVAETK